MLVKPTIVTITDIKNGKLFSAYYLKLSLINTRKIETIHQNN
jgi:hypothetical protein